MRICVVSLFTKEIELESRLSTLNKKKYCEKYNIDYKFFLGRLSKRHAQWDKIQCLIQLLPHYDYVVWMDSDTVFNNFDISLVDFISENKDYDSLFCSDVCYEVNSKHLLVNTGVMIFKNTEWSSDLLNKVWNSITDYNVEALDKHSYEGFPHEQGKMCEELLKEDGTKFKIFPHTTFNCHPNSKNDKTFIVHYMGSRQSTTHLNDFIKKVELTNQRLNIESDEDVNVIELNKYKICLVSHFTENIEHVANYTIQNKQKYCDKQGYSFKYHKGRLSDRHPGWDKIKLLKEVLLTDEFDYVVWVDNDACITNEEMRFDFICNLYSESNIILASEDDSRNIEFLNPSNDYNNLQNLRIINTGVMILKNNPWVINFLDEVWDTKSNTNRGVDYSHKSIIGNNFNYDQWPFEQGPIHIVLSKTDRNHYKIVKSEILNKFKSSHQKNNFICHFVGQGNDLESIRNYIESLKDDTNMIPVKNNKLIEKFKENETKIEITILTDNGNYFIKYIWDYQKTGLEHLSHSFKIKNGLDERVFDLDSKKTGKFKIDYSDKTEIYHTYNWFGEVSWNQIG
jgi:hypothetical protein